MVKRTESGTVYTQNFDTENRITSIVTGSQTTTFVYDGDGVLGKKVKPDGTYTLYIGGIYEVDLSSGGSVTKKTSYYPGGAMRADIVGGTNTLYYLLKDHLGSASVVLDSSGVLIANGEQRYYPYGEKRITTAALPTDRLYTGQLELASLGGIYHYGARFYSPRLGRFLSADSIVPSPYNPQSLNRFTYVLNNPLKYTDPTGHLPSYCQRFPAECRAEFGAVAPPFQPRVTPSGNSGSGFSNLYTPIVTNDLPRCCITVAEPDNGPKCCITTVEPDNGPRCCITVIEPVIGLGCCITIVEEISGLKCCITIVERRDEGPKIVAAKDSNGDGIPVIEVPADDYPEAAQHIRDAQNAGYPDILTIDRDPVRVAQRREDAIGGYPVVPGTHRDEYPPALFVEGGAGASVRYINPHDNAGAGACIGNQCRPYPDGTRVRIVVVGG
jgi:RHS repeat-associated protein